MLRSLSLILVLPALLSGCQLGEGACLAKDESWCLSYDRDTSRDPCGQLGGRWQSKCPTEGLVGTCVQGDDFYTADRLFYENYTGGLETYDSLETAPYACEERQDDWYVSGLGEEPGHCYSEEDSWCSRRDYVGRSYVWCDKRNGVLATGECPEENLVGSCVATNLGIRGEWITLYEGYEGEYESLSSLENAEADCEEEVNLGNGYSWFPGQPGRTSGFGGASTD